MHFNPRTRVGCDFLWRVVFRQHNISIHAPAWGATTISVRTATTLLLFQSTHPRGVRPSGTICGMKYPTYFNPRTRVGCDFQRYSTLEYYYISIHAPAWGATLVSSGAGALTIYFNPRTRVGCDNTPLIPSHMPVKFQSTHPRGVRRNRVSAIRYKLFISIHAPAWGATFFCRSLCAGTGYFNPRTRVGCDQVSTSGSRSYHISIHAPAWGATSPPKSLQAKCIISIHAPAWGATPAGY